MTNSRYDIPWLTAELKRMCKKKHRFYKRAQHTKKKKHRDAYQQLKKDTQRAIRAAHWTYINNILTESMEKKGIKTLLALHQITEAGKHRYCCTEEGWRTALWQYCQGGHTQRPI